MAVILFTMRDVEMAQFDQERRGIGLKEIAIGAGGIAGVALALKNRGAIRQAAGKAKQMVGGYFRRTKSGGQAFVRDARVGAPSVSNSVNKGGFEAKEIQGNINKLSQTSTSADPRIAAQRSSRQKSVNATGMGFSRKARTIYFSRR